MKTPLVVVLGILGLAMISKSEEAGSPAESGHFNISTLSGDTYKNSRLIKVTPADVTVMHDNGVARIDFENLSPAWQKKFTYDSAKARTHRQKMAALQREAEDRRRQLILQRERSERLAIAQIEANERRIATRNQEPLPLAPLPGEENRPPPPAPSLAEEIIPTLPPLGPVYSPGIHTQTRNSRPWRYGDGIYQVDGYYPPYLWNFPLHPWPLFSPPVHHPHPHPHPHSHSYPYSHGRSFLGPPAFRITR
jgi:hypothetical protein